MLSGMYVCISRNVYSHACTGFTPQFFILFLSDSTSLSLQFDNTNSPLFVHIIRRKKPLYHCDEHRQFVMMCIRFMEEGSPQKTSTTLSNFLERCVVCIRSMWILLVVFQMCISSLTHLCTRPFIILLRYM